MGVVGVGGRSVQVVCLPPGLCSLALAWPTVVCWEGRKLRPRLLLRAVLPSRGQLLGWGFKVPLPAIPAWLHDSLATVLHLSSCLGRVGEGAFLVIVPDCQGCSVCTWSTC